MKKSGKSALVAQMGLLFALAVVLSFVESMLPGIPGLIPGIRLGLSNIVTMYTLFFLGGRYALTLAVLKSAFVALTRGATAGMLSGCGGLLSVGVMLLLIACGKRRLSYLVLSAAGAVAHNLGQLLMASVLLGSALSLYYWPVLVLSGLLMGSVTAVILRAVLPHLRRISGTKSHGAGEEPASPRDLK